MRLKSLLSPKYGIVLTPIIFAFSQLIILGYYWIFEGYAGNFTLTISAYVGLRLWTSIFFAICNLIIVILEAIESLNVDTLRFYLMRNGPEKRDLYHIILFYHQ